MGDGRVALRHVRAGRVSDGLAIVPSLTRPAREAGSGHPRVSPNCRADHVRGSCGDAILQLALPSMKNSIDCRGYDLNELNAKVQLEGAALQRQGP